MYIKMITKSYIVGLPESGKTTFLGALAYTIMNSMPNVNMFELDKVENLDYMNNLAIIWSKCEEIGRTNLDQYESTTLFLKDGLGNRVELKLADQSGEEFKKVVMNRSMTENMYTEIMECNNIFLFVNPNVIKKDVMINDIAPKFRINSQENINSFNEKYVHEQVQYVMILQDIIRIKKEKTKIKVVISAWDAYEKGKCPQELLKEELPLLWQYLLSNQKLFDCEFWGVSAQGGDLMDASVKEQMLNYESAIERIRVIDEDNNELEHDLTVLLK